MPRENYYLLLELDPAIQDLTLIAIAIEKKQAEWSRDRNHPTKARQAQTNLNLISHIREIMVVDSFYREIEAKDAEFENRKQKNKSINELLELITVLAAPGFLLESQIVGISKQFQGKFSESEIRTLIKVPIKEASLDSEKPGEVLDKVVFKEITDRLAIIGKNNLYDFLGLLQSSNLDELVEKAKELGRDITAYNSKTPDLSAKQELIGHCLSLFKNKVEKDKYDNSCSQQIISDFDQIISLSVQNNIIPASVMEKLLKLYGGKGVSIKDAKKYILDFASVRKWSVEVIKSEPPKNFNKYIPYLIFGVIGMIIILVYLFNRGGGGAERKEKEVVESKKGKEEVEGLGVEVNLEMVLIPAGKFSIGSPSSETGRDKDETQHEVTLTKPFYMGKYEVTQEQWEGVMGDNPSETKGAKLPVTNVSWHDCQEFIKKLNTKTNGGYRLPTEAEWEYACRAGTTTAHFFGDSISRDNANWLGNNIKHVSDYNPNAFGLFNMHGNVWEWCNDWYGEYSVGAVINPEGPLMGEQRVLRGGSYYSMMSSARSANRAFFTPSDQNRFGGFRLARTADIKVTKPDPVKVMPAIVNLLVAPFSEAKAREARKEIAISLQKEVEEKEDLGKGIELELVLIPAGKFLMGSPSSETGRDKDETQHEVTLTNPYYMAKYEVTQEQWEGVMGDNPSATKGAKLPVTDISWFYCQEFINKLNAKTKGGYRLPTESEWEYACRAGTSTASSFGNSLTKSDANIDGSSIKAVGSYRPNAFGLYDMHGNVWEWCEDWKANYPVGAVTDQKGPGTGSSRVLRGGSFLNDLAFARSPKRNSSFPAAYRNYRSPTNLLSDFGFRLARTANFKVTKPAPIEEVKAEQMELVKLKQEEKAKAKQMELMKLMQEYEAKVKQVDLAMLKQEKEAKTVQMDLTMLMQEDEVKLESIEKDLVLIPAGKFLMGFPASETGRLTEEKQHEVTITKPYYIGKYEVTQEQWKAVIGNNPSETKRAKLPVTNVSWHDCQEFIRRLNARTDSTYRLPTEAEWEYACRAGTTTAYSYGDGLTKSDANIDGSSTKAVGSYKPNGFGLYDMHGNVWEWCEDYYGNYPAIAVTDPKGPVTGKLCVLRGGSFFLNVSAAHASFRFNVTPSSQANSAGFRLAKSK